MISMLTVDQSFLLTQHPFHSLPTVCCFQVKRDMDEETDSVDIYEQIINRLSSQLEEQAVAMDALRQTESNLRLSLRLAEQRALEAETEKAWLQERYEYMCVCYYCVLNNTHTDTCMHK